MSFFNKIKNNLEVDKSLQDIQDQMDRIDKMYSNPQNIDREISPSDWWTYYDADARSILVKYYTKVRLLTRFTKDIHDMKAVIEGNGGFWGQYQVNYKECQDRLESANLKLQLEKDMYLKLYEKNRELESKLYITERELEILKSEKK